MKCQILHETKNRMRVHFCKENMTIEEADKADAYLKSISGIDDVTVYERTGDLIIYYSFDRSELIEILAHFSFENDEVKNIEIVGTARLVQREYEEKLIMTIALRYFRKIFYPLPLRIALAYIKSIKYILKALKSLAKGQLSVSVADEQGGKLKNRCVFLCDEYGTLPKIESAEMMFSASRSRRLQIVAIIQSLQQLEKNYGKEGAAIIVDNTQLTIFGGFAPNSVTAESMSKALGSRTVMSGSVSRSVNDPSQSLQMIERPLMTADELKSMPKGQFIVMKTGVYPMKVKLQLFFKWGIKFEEAYAVNERGNRTVKYASSKKLISSILEKYAHTSNKENRPYAPPGEYGESSAPPVSVAILNAVKQELDKHDTELRTQSTFEQIRNSIKAN